MIKDIFLERKQYADVIVKRIQGLKDGYRQNIAVIGDELAGKTSLIFGILNKFYDSRFILVYVEARPETLDSFVRRFIGVLLYNFLAIGNIPLREDIDFLIDKSSRYIPKTVISIKQIISALKKRSKSGVFGELLSLCEIIHQETGKFCVVIFDEFLNLENITVKNLYSEWTRLLILQKSTMYIITSSSQHKARTVLSKNLSLLFGNFEVINIEPFDIKESERYLELKIKQSNLDSGLKNFIVYFTGGCPFYLKIITDALSKTGGAIGLAEIIEEMLLDDSGILNQRFSNLIKRLSVFSSLPEIAGEGKNQDYLCVLYSIANGQNKLKEIAHLLHKSAKEIESKANSLSELNFITRSGNFLKINDKLFAFWLKYVYRERLQSLTFDAKTQRDSFREKIGAIIQEFLVDVRKPIAERVGELLRLFENDTIQIEKKRLKLSQFREIKQIEFSKSRLKQGLLGRSSDSLWIMAFKHDLVTEEDITEFAEECKKYRHKLQKRIIVTLCDIEDNAKLRALEEKIWTWDLNNLNQILDLFSKPGVPVLSEI